MLSRNPLIISFFVAMACLSVCLAADTGAENVSAFAGQDLHLAGKMVYSYQLITTEHSLVFTDGFSMSIGGVSFSSDTAVVWLKSIVRELHGRKYIDYAVTVYLQGNVAEKKSKNGLTVNIREKTVEQGQAVVIQFEVSGEVFITAQTREVADPRELELYKKALSVSESVGPTFVIQKQAMVPQWTPELAKKLEKVTEEKAAEKEEKPAAEKRKKEQVSKPGFIEKVVAAEKTKVPVTEEQKQPKFAYPVNIAPVGQQMPRMESAPTEEGIDAATIIGRFYIWQKQDETGRLLELQADRAVIFYLRQQLGNEQQDKVSEDILPRAIRAIYLAGNVVLSEGDRTIRADEIYYDFENHNAIALNAVMRSFDADRGIPIYVRATKLRRLSESRFAAENVTVTTSEFYKPQISATASAVVVTDTTVTDAQAGKVTDSSYDAEMHDVRFKMGDTTIFAWPFMRSNLERPDVPLRRIRFGHDSNFGYSVETEWFFARLLGLREPQGVKGTLFADYFSKRGFGVGAEFTYTRENYYGSILGYMIDDHGEDDLGRHYTRENLKSGEDIRGRFSWRHRQFLPFRWQLTTEINYASDERFVEAFYRNEFNVKKQETYIHLKNIEDNRGISILGKWRINDFADELEQLPSLEYHLAGQSFFEDRLTMYSDIQVSRFEQKIGHDHNIQIDGNPFSFISYRTEVDMPLKVDSFKIVPYVAATVGYDDRSGFRRSLVDGTYTGRFGEDRVWIAEGGVRIFPRPFWKVYPNVKSRLWDLDQLRHIIQPSITAAVFKESDSVVDQPDIFSLALSQRLQTKRGPEGNKQTVDWMRLDTEFVFVEDSGDVSDAGPGPDRMLWAKPIVPLRVLSAPDIFHGDLIGSLHRFEMYGPRRDYFFADYLWRVSDTTTVLGELNYDIQSGVAQQVNLGFSRLCWPNLSYYIGTRYLRRTEVLREKGTNSFVFAATYILDPRYTMVFSQQYDFDYGASVRSDIMLIRKYHRVSCALTVSADESLDSRAIMFSIWPEGIRELALGERRFIELGGYAGY
jgi:hypothetical protein